MGSTLDARRAGTTLAATAISPSANATGTVVRTTRDVTRLVLSQSIRPVGFGLFIGGGSAAGLAALLRATPAAATIGEIVHVLDPVAYAVSLVCIVPACALAALIPARRAARIDPINTLRQN